MGVPNTCNLSESERKSLFDPKPLKYYRPELRSQRKSLEEQVSQLSIGPQLASNLPTGSGPLTSSLQREEKSGLPSVLGTVTRQHRQHRHHKYSFSVREYKVPSLPKDQVTATDFQTSDDCQQQFIEHDHRQHYNRGNKCVSTKTPVRRGDEKTRKGQSQCWRLGVHATNFEDFQSAVQSPTGDVPRMASTPIGSSGPTQERDIESKSLITKNLDFHNQLNQPLSHEKHGSSEISFDESSLSTVDGVGPLISDDLVSGVSSLPDNSRRRLQLDQSTENSSGIGSLNCSVQTNSGRSSPVSKEMSQQLPQASVEQSNDRLGHVSSSLDHSYDSQMSENLSCQSERSCTSQVVPGKKVPGPESKKYPNSLSESMRRDYTSSSDSGISGSSPGQVVQSWKASFSVEHEKPTSSELNFRKNGSKEFKSKWDPESSNTSMASMGLPTSFGPRNASKRKSADVILSSTDVNEVLRQCFSKQFAFESADWGLPDPDTLFTSKPWEIQQFLRQKQRLNTVKDELNDLPLQDWHKHTRRRNTAGNIIWQLRNKIDPEFPTQAWCKFYENVSSFPLVPSKAVDCRRLNSIHLCEAPGAFITSLNHFLHVNYGDDFKFDWRAVTLNPYYEGNPLSCMINDDRLILKTLDKWLFGEDNTGDLMQPQNLKSIVEGASQLGEILLVTADGSIDCQDNPAEQEELVSWLHYCECLTALKILAPGGSFLIKMFTFYEHFSIGLLYLLNCVFKKVVVNKPATSKEGNSEVYVVCLHYQGAKSIAPWLDVLEKNYGPTAPDHTLFPLDSIPVSFLDQLYRCADLFRKFQTHVIEENLRSFHHPAKQDNYFIARIRNRVAEEFFSRNKLKKLDRKFCLVDKRNINNIATPNIDPRQEEGSFNDRRKRLTLSPEEELKYLKDDLDHLAAAWPGDFDVFWIDFPENPHNFKIVRGKPITKVHSSKFCLGRLLKIRNRVREIAHTHYNVNVSQELNTGSENRTFPWPNEADSPSKRKVLTLDFKNKLWASLEDGNNALHEMNACTEILSVIEHDIFRDYSLEIRGYPLLTQFNVGLVFLLGHLFDKVGFVKPKGQDIRVLFYNYRNFNPEMKRHWDDVVAGMKQDGEAVLSVIQISELSDGDFYKYVTEINNLCVQEQIEDLLALMSAGDQKSC